MMMMNGWVGSNIRNKVLRYKGWADENGTTLKIFDMTLNTGSQGYQAGKNQKDEY